MPELDAEHRDQIANLVCDALRSIAPERCPGCRHVADALAPLVAGWLADAWDAGYCDGRDDERLEVEMARTARNPYRGGDDG